MPFYRRQFLKFAATSTLTTLGINKLHLKRKSRVLASTTPRKLALLVGINSYPTNSLRGCLMDVELQKTLLIHRYGFKPQDILILTNNQATCGNILKSFEHHLIEQAKPGDVVVFHFSGYGSQLRDPDCDRPDCLTSTLVAVDNLDITQQTIKLLMTAVNTENITAVLDCDDAGKGNRGNLHLRCHPKKVISEITATEKTYQQQWLSRLNLSASEFIRQRRTGAIKGVILSATGQDKLSAEAPFNGFYAGVFTYYLTQHIWQQTGNESVESCIANVARSLTPQILPQPQLEVKPNSGNEKKPIYFMQPSTPPAEAVVTQVSSDRLQLWLGGIYPQILPAFGGGAVLTLVDNTGKEQAQVQILSRQGLIAQGKLQNTSAVTVQPGMLLQERIRGITANFKLNIGLNLALDLEVAQATQALETIPYLDVVSLPDSEVHYIFGRITTPNPLPVGSLGLFTPSLNPLLETFGTSNETITDAIKRLQTTFKSLLATTMLKLALNTHSSALNVAVSLNVEGKPQQLIAQATPNRGNSNPHQPQQFTSQVPLKTNVQFRLLNNEPRDLYFCILVIDSQQQISVIFPNQWGAEETYTKVKPNQMLLVPEPNTDPFVLATQAPQGITEVLVVASTTPLRKVLLALRQIANRGPVTLDTSSNPIDFISNLLADVSADADTTTYKLDKTQLAVMSLLFEVI